MSNISMAFEHSAWATKTVTDLAEGLSSEALHKAFGNAYLPVSGIIGHLVDAEASFLAAVRGETAPPAPRDGAGLDELRAAFRPVAEGWAAWFERPEAREDGRQVFIPWFEREVPQDDVLLQVLLHSGQHRSDVALLLSLQGVEVPPLDFVLWRLGYVGGGA